MTYRFVLSLLLLGAAVFPGTSAAQCLSYPVSFAERVNGAQSLVLGTVTSQHCYADEKGNIYTLNKVTVDAWMKDHRAAGEVYIITIGGVMNGKAQLTFPAVQLEKGRKYFLMLEKDNTVSDDPSTRAVEPGTIQAFPFADAQGAWIYDRNQYHDPFYGASTEAELLQKLSGFGLVAKRPDGSAYTPRTEQSRPDRTNEITSFSPNPTNAGTVNPSEYLTINGSGFGNTVGTVQFPNADNGGSSTITPPNTSDYVTWTDNQVVVKVPTGSSNNAGTGNFNVISASGTGFFVSPQPLTIGYSHISINSSFSNFASATRQRYYLRNLDGVGGYTFQYNTNFAANTAAVASFERALNTWKCNTGINWRASAITTPAVYTDDDINTVLFDATLPSGVLARATSRFSGSAVPGTCDQQNTVWWLEEVDVQVRETGVTWQYGPALATGSQYDFETVLLHELGHAHGLGHRIAPGQLMNYALSNATNIRTPAAVEIQGGQAKVAYSTVPTCFNPSNSGTPMTAAAGCGLPLRLLDFSGELRSYGALLLWKTENELNSDRFEIERSTDGSTFAAVGTVKATGVAGRQSSYHFVDGSIRQGTYYYRLKMMDKDGSFTYSGIVSLKLGSALKPVSVYPNPAIRELKVASATKRTMELLDAAGRLVWKIQVNAGDNTIGIASLGNGIYYLSDKDSGSRTRILVMH